MTSTTTPPSSTTKEPDKDEWYLREDVEFLPRKFGSSDFKLCLIGSVCHFSGSAVALTVLVSSLTPDPDQILISQKQKSEWDYTFLQIKFWAHYPGLPEEAACVCVRLFFHKGQLLLEVARRSGDRNVTWRVYHQLRQLLANLPGVTPCDESGKPLDGQLLEDIYKAYKKFPGIPPKLKSTEFPLPPATLGSFSWQLEALKSKFNCTHGCAVQSLVENLRNPSSGALEALENHLGLLKRLLELAIISNSETRRYSVVALLLLLEKSEAVKYAKEQSEKGQLDLSALVRLAQGLDASGEALQPTEEGMVGEMMTRRLCVKIIFRFCSQGFWRVFFKTHELAQAGLEQVKESSRDARLIELAHDCASACAKDCAV